MQVTVPCQVWITQTEARAEVKDPLKGDVIFLISKGNFYQLDPKSHRGIRGPLPPELRKSRDNFQFFVARFSFDASKAIEHSKKTGTETVSGYLCDVFVNSETDSGGTHSIKVWVPQKMDPKLPVKAVKSQKINKPGATVEDTITMILSNIKLNQPIPASTFAVPSGYKIEAGKPAPPRPHK
jgi:hypothetical protein